MDRLGWPGVGAAFGAWVWPWLPVDMPEAAVVLCAALALVVGCREVAQRVGLGVAGLAIGWMAVASQPAGPVLRGPGVLEAVVLGAPMGREVVVQAAAWTPWNGERQLVRGRVSLRMATPSGQAPGPGRVVRAFGIGGRGARASLPGAPSAWAQGARARQVSQLVVRDVVVVGAQAVAPARAINGLSWALITGDRSRVPPELTSRMRATGTSHLLAISGFHVGLVAAVGVVLGRALRALVAWRRPEGAPAWWVVLCVVGLSVGFAVAVGRPVSAVRAAGVVSLGAWGRWDGRLVSVRSLLGAVALAQVVWDPAVVGLPSFQLSFGAVVGLLTWSPLLMAWVPARPVAREGWAGWCLGWLAKAVWGVANGLCASVAATLGTLPAALWWFQALPPASPLANAVAMPLAPPLVAVSAWGVLAPDAVGGGLAAWVADGLVTALFDVLGPFEGVVWHPAVGPAGAVLLAVGLAWPTAPGGAGRVVWALLVALGMRSMPVEGVAISLDVGQGDATLLEDGRGGRWLVDTGSWAGSVVGWLRRTGRTRLDVLVLTHGDADHAGGAVGVLQAVAVGEVWLPDLPPAADAGALPEVVAAARSAGVPVVVRPRQALWPAPRRVPGSGNARSLVTAPCVGGHRVVLPGDIARTEAEQIAWPHATVLRLPHHGSRFATEGALVAAVKPALAVVGAGRAGRYGHPHAEVREVLARAGVPLRRSDRDGTVAVWLRADRVRWRAWGLVVPPWWIGGTLGVGSPGWHTVARPDPAASLGVSPQLGCGADRGTTAATVLQPPPPPPR